MPTPPSAPAARRATLSEVLRDLRRHRGLGPGEVARRMALPRRSYERFEAGEGRLNFARIEAFARATQSDPHAILAAVWTGAPRLARCCADNKLATLWLMALQNFDLQAGEAIRQLDAHTLLSEFEEAFAKLGEIAVQRQAAADAWLEPRDAPQDHDQD